MIRLAALAFAAVVLVGHAGGPAQAAACPPDWPAALPCPQAPYELAAVEHRDRMERLVRLTEGDNAFAFYEDEILPADHGIADFPAPIPILRVVARQDVFFDSGSDVIRREANPLIDVIAESLRREPPDVSLFIAGHTDWDGGVDYNYRLGLGRARSVAAALLRRGVYQASIYQVSFGELMPIDTNETELGKARNRRVEFLFAARTEAIVQHLVRQPILPCDTDILEAFGDCRAPIRIEAERVTVSSAHERRVLELAEEQRRIESDPSLTAVEAERRREVIEAARERIPIVIPHERVEIVLDPLAK